MYLVVSNRDAAETISRRLYQLRRPNPDDGDITIYWCRVVEHSDGRAAVDMRTTATARIDAQADPTELVEAINGRMTARQKQDAREAITSVRGSRRTLSQILPAQVRAPLVSREAMESDGWFDNEL